MSPDGADPREPDEDPSLGEPVTGLRDVSVAVEARFAARVRGRIERRVLAGEALELMWTAPLAILVEFLRWPFEALQGRRR